MTATPNLRTLLEQVADGRLEPDLAAAMLAGGPTSPAGDAGARPGRSDAAHARVRPPTRLEVIVDALDLTVVADPSVERFHVDGDLEVIERPDGVVELRLPTRSPSGDAYRFGAMGGLMAGWLQGRQWKARVRVPATVPVSVATNASKVEIVGMTGGLNVRAAASAVRLQDVHGPLALDLQSSSAKGTAVIAAGQSQIRGTMSSLDLALGESSDVRIAMTTEMGQARIKGRKSVSSGVSESIEWTLGHGTADLDVRMTMSGAKITLP